MTTPAPTFLQPAAVTFNANTGPVSLGIPWVVDFGIVGPQDLVCVLTQPSASSVAGLWVLLPTTEHTRASTGLAVKWKLGLGFREVCNVIAVGAVLQIFVNVESSASFPPGYTVWKNGHLQDSADVFPEDGAVWVVTHVPSSGGGGGGDVSLTATQLPNDLPTPQPGDPKIDLNESGVSVSHLNLQPLRSIGGVDLGLLVTGLNR